MPAQDGPGEPKTHARAANKSPGSVSPEAARRGPEAQKHVEDIVFTMFYAMPKAPPRAPRGQDAPGAGHFGPPAGRFCTLWGSIFVHFSSLGKHSQSCPVGKACASIRPAPLYLLV